MRAPQAVRPLSTAGLKRPRKGGRGVRSSSGAAGVFSQKKRSACAAERKSVNPLSQVGAPLCRIRLSVHKQTLPIVTDHLEERSRVSNVD